MTPKPRVLGAMLSGGNARLTSLTAESRVRFSLRDHVRRCLPTAFAPRCSGAELEAGTLTVYMDSAANATVLRYQQRELQSRLAADGLTCDRIRVQVLPKVLPPAAAPRTAREFAESARRRLETTAASLEDGALRRSIQKLARGRDEPR